MKKLLTLLFGAIVLFSFVSCGNKETTFTVHYITLEEKEITDDDGSTSKEKYNLNNTKSFSFANDKKMSEALNDIKNDSAYSNSVEEANSNTKYSSNCLGIFIGKGTPSNIKPTDDSDPYIKTYGMLNSSSSIAKKIDPTNPTSLKSYDWIDLSVALGLADDDATVGEIPDLMKGDIATFIKSAINDDLGDDIPDLYVVYVTNSI